MAVSFIWRYLLLIVIIKYATNAPCERNDTALETVGRFCAAPCTREQTCRSERRRCVCDGECGLVCVQDDLQCSPLNNPDNGHVTAVSLNYDTIATYACSEGFRLLGDRERRCQGDATWSGREPVCQEEPSCSIEGWKKPSSVLLQRHLKSRYLEGEEIRFICSRGFNLQPQTDFGLYRCGRGEWLGSEYSCIPKGCRLPPSPDNGQAVAQSKLVGHGEHAKFYCFPGYDLKGSVKALCNRGHWDFPHGEPFCQHMDYEEDTLALESLPEIGSSLSESPPVLPPPPPPPLETVVHPIPELESDPWWDETIPEEEQGPEGTCYVPHRPNVLAFEGDKQVPLSVTWLPEGIELTFRCIDISRFRARGTSKRTCEEGRWTGIPFTCLELMPGNRNSPPVIEYQVEWGTAFVGPDGTLFVTKDSNLHLACVWPLSMGAPKWHYSRLREDDSYHERWNTGEDMFSLSVWGIQEEDSGNYNCTSPRGRTHAVPVKVVSSHPAELLQEFRPEKDAPETEPGVDYYPCKLERKPNVVSYYNGREIRGEATLYHGATVARQCRDSGVFRFSGSYKITCQDGEWIPDATAECRRLLRNSDMPPPIVVGTLSPKATLDDGSIVVVPGDLITLDCMWVVPEPGDGWYHPTWFQSTPQGDLELRAEIIRHLHPNGRGTYFSYRVGFVAALSDRPTTYTCLTPYDVRNNLVIRVSAFCTMDTAPIPSFAVLDPESLKHVYLEGESIKFLGCNRGTLVGHNLLTCLRTGTWSHPLTRCRQS